MAYIVVRKVVPASAPKKRAQRLRTFLSIIVAPNKTHVEELCRLLEELGRSANCQFFAVPDNKPDQDDATEKIGDKISKKLKHSNPFKGKFVIRGRRYSWLSWGKSNKTHVEELCLLLEECGWFAVRQG